MKPPRDGQRNWQYANGSLMINALFWPGLLLLLSITMRPTAGITAPLPLPLELPLSELPSALPLQHHYHPRPPHDHHHPGSNYYEPALESSSAAETELESEALAGLAGYTQHYYGANSAAGTRQTLQDVSNVGDVSDIGDLAAAPYANYEPKAITANGFVPTTALHGYSYSNSNNYNTLYNNRLHSHPHPPDAYDVVGGQRGKIDFVINTANYEHDGNGEQQQHYQQQQQQHHQSPAIYYQSYGYQPQPEAALAGPLPPLLDYPIEQFSNYHHTAAGHREEDKVAPQPRQLNNDNAMAYASSFQHATLAVQHTPDQQLQRQQQQQQHLQQQHLQQQHLQQHQRQQRQESAPRAQAEDQLASRHLVDLPGHPGSNGRGISSPNALPPITTSVHHNPSSSKALAGLPLAKHIEVTKNVPVTYYQKQHVPYRQSVPLRISRPVITTIPKPIPIRVPVSKTVAVPQLQEVKIPIEKVKPVAVERPIPFVVERRVPYRVEKPVATPVYYPYPIKVPVVRTVVHKQRPSQGPHHRWTPHNNLLG